MSCHFQAIVTNPPFFFSQLSTLRVLLFFFYVLNGPFFLSHDPLETRYGDLRVRSLFLRPAGRLFFVCRSGVMSIRDRLKRRLETHTVAHDEQERGGLPISIVLPHVRAHPLVPLMELESKVERIAELICRPPTIAGATTVARTAAAAPCREDDDDEDAADVLYCPRETYCPLCKGVTQTSLDQRQGCAS